ncbi:hypothetical protein BU23DRAFT_604620 [Bimuria novae-zelandiae CBS 107.79]|uniref:Uncharacterized protein n=1 Tax=Bimuria novae-zelandiae CBS 107.79 TaxID=1447943 RepID=A0A6A5ULV4_9PLEO|nr:hypothetical protein BU23DRAFT_604620 [Bimuria novae-zelandiae CBS 107.79]
MAPDERNSTPVSTASEDSTPLTKRRRVETATDSRTNDTIRTCPSPTEDCDPADHPKQQTAEACPHQEALNGVVTPEHEQPKPRRFFIEPFKTIVTLECGPKLNTHYKVDLGLLCAHSEQQYMLFSHAEDQVQLYAKVKALKQRAKAFRPLLTLHNVLRTDTSRGKALSFITECMEKFPIIPRQVQVIATITDAVDAVFQKSELFKSPPTKKFDRSKYPRENVHDRLQLLRDEAVYTVAERISFYLCGIKRQEKDFALKDATKAAAQRRIILHKMGPETVEAVMRWVYGKGLTFNSVKHALSIHALACTLGITRLAAECMELLSAATIRIINQTKSDGITLRDLLSNNICEPEEETSTNRDPDPLSNVRVVGEVFKYTLHEKKPPAVLQALVVDAVADSEDEDLLSQSMELMNSEMLGKLAMATMRRANLHSLAARTHGYGQPLLHSDASPSASIKSDMSDTKYDWKSKNNGTDSEMAPTVGDNVLGCKAEAK